MLQLPIKYKYPNPRLITEVDNIGIDKESEVYKQHLQRLLAINNLKYDAITATSGPNTILYEIRPSLGTPVAKFKKLRDDFAMVLKAKSFRMIAPMPGKGTIGIEVSNSSKTVISLRSLITLQDFINNVMVLPIVLGKSVTNEVIIGDLEEMPHLLMAGATGQGKSVGIHTMLLSLLFKKHPLQLKLVLIDPKKVELSIYSKITKQFLAKLPNHNEAIITNTRDAIYAFNSLCIEMDSRYDLLKNAGCRNIRQYNDRVLIGSLQTQDSNKHLPMIVVVVDEFADLIFNAGREIELPISRLAQLARAVGIHLIIATQRPSVKVITGLIKANFPARIAFKVSSKIDSQIILEKAGAEQLLGKGDMLFSYNGELTRLQGAYVAMKDIQQVLSFIAEQDYQSEQYYLSEYYEDV